MLAIQQPNRSLVHKANQSGTEFCRQSVNIRSIWPWVAETDERERSQGAQQGERRKVTEEGHEAHGLGAVGGNEGGWMDAAKDHPTNRWDWTACTAMDTSQECERAQGAWKTGDVSGCATGKSGKKFFGVLFSFSAINEWYFPLSRSSHAYRGICAPTR
ncbi:uncharacterized protein BJX67DRAFT_99094 [Aspergillus lucknowensis]|uniref:Uncharacterized protein n=1 Tax=Aspergillus lucknowensis TaxID=176173 RepID=A0ABR4M677_9EURO